MFERIRQMLIKEFIQVFRDPRMRTVIFVIPCVQVLVIGYAVTTDVRHVPTAVYDLDNSARQPRADRPGSLRSGYFDVVAYVDDRRQARELIDRGEATDAAADRPRLRRRPPRRPHRPVQVILDGSDSNTAGDRAGLRRQDRRRNTRSRFSSSRYRRLAGGDQPAGRRSTCGRRAWFNENLESRNYFVPGVIVIVVTLVTLLLTSMAVVREKEIGTMEQIMVTPITPAEFILGKTLPFALIGFVDVTLVAADRHLLVRGAACAAALPCCTSPPACT